MFEIRQANAFFSRSSARSLVTFVASAQQAHTEAPTPAQQTLEFPTVLYGAAYYNEYMPGDQDARLDERHRDDEGRGAERGAHGRVDVEPVGAGGRPLRIRVDGPHCGCDGQSRHQGDSGHAHVFDSGVDGAPASGDSGRSHYRRTFRRSDCSLRSTACGRTWIPIRPHTGFMRSG